MKKVNRKASISLCVPELVELYEQVAVEVVEVLQGRPGVGGGGGVWGGERGRVVKVRLGGALAQEAVSHVGQVDAHDGEGVPGMFKVVYLWEKPFECYEGKYTKESGQSKATAMLY